MDQNGLTCEMWRNTAYNQDVNFPHDDSVDAVMNYCRDPEGTIGTPWCYTTYDVIRWEFCAVQLCDGMLTLCMLGKNLSRRHFEKFSYFF